MTESTQQSGWRLVLANLRKPKVRMMLMLGFSSGLPISLVGNTLSFWMREYDVDLSVIGFMGWVGIAYSFKFLWTPLVDQFDAPLLGRWLGRRRGWMLLSQLFIAAALMGMALIKPQNGVMTVFGHELNQLVPFALMAVVVAFASATQDIVIDAWRIETANNDEEQSLLTSTSLLGYRGALLVADSLILILAAHIGWAISYELMAVLMGLGVYATWRCSEPIRTDHQATSLIPGQSFILQLVDGVIGPFVAFIKSHGRWAMVMLLAISLYRLPDFVMGPMANPFYADLGIGKEAVGGVRGSVGLVAATLGVAAAGLSAVRFGFVLTLIAGAVLGPGSNMAFAGLAWYGGADLTMFSAAMAVDNFCSGFASVALVAYMSSLTSIGYTATQYALLSSFYALLGKTLKGFSGLMVERLQATGLSLIDAYGWFFTGTAVVGVPAVLLCVLLLWQRQETSKSVG